MLNTIILTLIALILFHFFAIVPVFGKGGNLETETTKIKADLTQRGVGKRNVKIELRDGHEIKGYIAELDEDDFAIDDLNTDVRTTITYREVKKVKGQGFSFGNKLALAGIALGVGVGVAIAAGSNRKVKCAICR